MSPMAAGGSTAEAGSEAEVDDPGRSLLVFRVGESRYGVWLDEVLEILRTPPISKLPLSRAEVAGVTGIRGEVIPVLDLGVRLLGSPCARPGRLVLVRHIESDSLVALLVDAVETLLAVREDEDVEAAPPEAEAELPEAMVIGVVTGEDGAIAILHMGVAAAPPAGATEEG